MKDILVTGAAGFIGSKLTAELIRQENRVHALIEKGDESSRKLLVNISSEIDIIDDMDQMLEYASSYPAFDRIFHLATVGVNPDFKDINLLCDVNIKLGCQLVDFAINNGSKLLVNFGSCFEYGDHGNVLLKEEMACKPTTLYAASKNAATNLVTCYAKSKNVNMITVRPFGVFGEGEGKNRLAPSIIYSCLHNMAVKTTDGKQIRDFVNVKDLVKAVIQLSESSYSAFEIYNICSNNPVSVKDFIMEIVDICGFDKRLIELGGIPHRQGEAMIFAGSNKKLQKVIHYPFPDNHREGIMDIYNRMKMEMG